MKVLVIDDNGPNRESALFSLKGHEVVLASGWNEARTLLVGGDHYSRDYSNPNGFDVVLTDMMMPAEADGLRDRSQAYEPTPYGFVIALLAIRCGVKKVAVVSDGNHHDTPLMWAGDHLLRHDFGGLFFFLGDSCPQLTKEEYAEFVEQIEDPFSIELMSNEDWEDPWTSAPKNWGKVLEKLAS